MIYKTLKITNMSILYKPEKFPEPGVAGGGNPRYRAAIVYKEHIDFDRMVYDIEKITSLSQDTILASILAMRERIRYYGMHSSTLYIPHLGTFKPVIKSDTCDSEKKVNASLIRYTRMVLRPCKELEDDFRMVDYKRYR